MIHNGNMEHVRAIWVCLLLLAGLAVLTPRQADARDVPRGLPIILAKSPDLRQRVLPRRPRVEGRQLQRPRARPRIRRPLPPRQGVAPRPAARAPVLGASSALNRVLRQYPDSKPLGVRLLPGRKPVYAVRVRRGNRVIIKRIDARTGRELR